MSATPQLLEQVLAAFGAKQVNVNDLPGDDPAAKLGKVCGSLFTEGVATLRSLIPNDRIRAIARVIWDLVGHKRVLVALGPDVTSLSFTVMRHGTVDQGLVLIPKNWPEMVDEDRFMQLGAILFVGTQVVDFYNDRLIGDLTAGPRWEAHEAELLRTLARILPMSWQPNEYQRGVLRRYPDGLDSPGVVLYPYRSYEPPKGDA